MKAPAPASVAPQPTVKTPIPPYRPGQPVYSYFVAPGSNFAFLAPHPLTGTTPLQSINNVNINNTNVSSATTPQIYAVPTVLGAVPGLPLSAGSTVPSNANTTTTTNSNNNTTAINNATITTASDTPAASEGVTTGVDNTPPGGMPVVAGQTPPLISLSAGTSPVLSPGSVKYSPKEFLNFTEDDSPLAGFTPPLVLTSPSSIGSASSPLGIDHVFALPKNKKRKIDEISSPNEDPHRPFSEESVMTSHVIPLSTNHVTKQQQQDDAIMTTLSSPLGASQGTGSAITPVFALTTSVPNTLASSEDDELSTSTATNATQSAQPNVGPKKKDLKITIPSHGLFVAPYPVMLAQPGHDTQDNTDTSKLGHVFPGTGPATPGPLLVPPMTPHLVTPLGANFEFPQFFLPQSPFVQSPLMTPTFAPFYSFMPSPKTN